MTQTDAPFRVLIVDDHRMVADAFERAVSLESDMEPAGIAGSIDEALRILKEGIVDVVLMDVYLPGEDGIEGTARIKADHPETRVVVMTGDPDLEMVSRAAVAGACGFIPKHAPLADILSAVRTARDGGLVVDPSILPGLLGKVREQKLPSPQSLPAPLTEREQEVLSLMSDGMDPASIAKKLFISIHTSRGYVKKILMKLDAHSQLEAVVKATRLGLVRG